MHMTLSYMTELCIPVASIRDRSALRSAAHSILFVPWICLELGKRVFTVAGPASWNNLPVAFRVHQHVTSLNSVWRLISSDNHIACSFSWAVANYIPIFSVRRPCSVHWHVTAPYKLSCYYYYYYYYTHTHTHTQKWPHVIFSPQCYKTISGYD